MTSSLPDLPRPITSFGAAVLDGAVYVHGGHHGQAHHYSREGQSGELLRLDPADGGTWTVVADEPRRQGHALAAHRESLYRLGGFTANNSDDEEQDLWSTADFSRFDWKTGSWEELPPAPEPRSSFDAAVAGDVLFVAGGWAMAGNRDADWCATAASIDLTSSPLQWRTFPAPFQRRAVAVGTLAGSFLVVGGMQPDGAVTRETAIFDPQDERWSTGPELPGDDMEGFGAACCEMDGALYVGTASGAVLKLDALGAEWRPAGRLSAGRFFHQMLPLGGGRLAALGGASMQTGKFASVEVFEPEA